MNKNQVIQVKDKNGKQVVITLVDDKYVIIDCEGDLMCLDHNTFLKVIGHIRSKEEFSHII